MGEMYRHAFSDRLWRDIPVKALRMETCGTLSVRLTGVNELDT